MLLRDNGFTLVEMAMVLVIIGLLLGGILGPLSAQIEVSNIKATTATMEQVKDALYGFAMAKGRFPCPATSTTSYTTEDPVSGTGICTTQYGNVPYNTLGLVGTVNSSNQMVDNWGYPILYNVTSASSNVFTKPSGITGTSMATLSGLTLFTAKCNAPDCSPAVTYTTQAPVVLVSTGRNGPPGTSTNETENTNNDTIFAKQGPNDSTANYYDDIVTWISMYGLFTKMSAAGLTMTP